MDSPQKRKKSQAACEKQNQEASKNTLAFGKKLKAWRIARGVSAYMIEKQTGVSRSNLSSIEAGRRPASDAVLQKLANLPQLEITYEALRRWKAEDSFPEVTSEEMMLNLSEQRFGPNLFVDYLKSQSPEMRQQFFVALHAMTSVDERQAAALEILKTLSTETVLELIAEYQKHRE